MRYLFGDSTESDLEFNYLAFLRDVFDCVVVMLEAEATLVANVDKRKSRENQIAGMIRAVEELGKDAIALVEPVAKEQPKAPVGRCASAIVAAIREAVSRESAQAKGELATARAAVDEEDATARVRVYNVLEKLLRQHDLPNAESEREFGWAGGKPVVTMLQKTTFGLEANVMLEVAPGSLFASDLLVQRIDERVEVHALESGGWLKKSDKLVPHKLARYQVVGIATTGDMASIKLRAPDQNDTGLTITVKRGEPVKIVGSGNNATKDFSIEERDREGVKALTDRLIDALKKLDKRSTIVAVNVDGKELADHAHPRVLAERFIAAIAPTVQKIVKHSRNPGELVLRQLLANDRREEIFIEISELSSKTTNLPPQARAVFAPLGLGIGEGLAPSPKIESKPEPKPLGRGDQGPPEHKVEAKPLEPRPLEPRPLEPRPLEPKPNDAKPLEVRHSDTKPLHLRGDSKPTDLKVQIPDAKRDAKSEHKPLDLHVYEVRPQAKEPSDVRPSETWPADRLADKPADRLADVRLPGDRLADKPTDKVPDKSAADKPSNAKPEAKLSDVRTAPRTSPTDAPRTRTPTSPGQVEPRSRAPSNPGLAAAIPHGAPHEKPKTVPPTLLRSDAPQPMLGVRPAGSQPSKQIEIEVDDPDDLPPVK